MHNTSFEVWNFITQKIQKKYREMRYVNLEASKIHLSFVLFSLLLQLELIHNLCDFLVSPEMLSDDYE